MRQQRTYGSGRGGLEGLRAQDRGHRRSRGGASGGEVPVYMPGAA
jgi:hypothetical protein